MLREIVWWAVFLAFNVAVIWCDLRWRRVPNALVLCGLFAQLLWLTAHAVSDAPPGVGAQGFSDALTAFALGLLFVVFWKLRLMGAGDVKYLAVLGLVLGIWPWLMVLVFSAIPCGLHALAQGFQVARNPRRSRRGVPYAAYLALVAASLALMPSSSPWCSWCSSWLSTVF
ncbi:type 4 prepilin leader peptidase [Bordetella ansorpii]|uniref:Type 4 prepilin leader peptidase n=1 Tax=Bordetella ansorpii TaxID=288768 RepID=A0A157SPQ0_9BORD|nr:A24 family peptidase [Bordetella ansorpii]SAI72459.1 type 4 prepilin leader peptidase [Bordetella ansorpii]